MYLFLRSSPSVAKIYRKGSTQSVDLTAAWVSANPDGPLPTWGDLSEATLCSACMVLADMTGDHDVALRLAPALVRECLALCQENVLVISERELFCWCIQALAELLFSTYPDAQHREGHYSAN